MRQLIVVVIVSGCATSPAQDPCVGAAEHVAACTGETPTADPATSCDTARADQLLDMSCEQIAEAAAMGKADGLWDSLLCGFGFTSHCPGGDSGSDSEPTLRTLNGMVEKVGTTVGASGVYVRATRSDNAADVHGSWTFAGGVFSISDLAPASFRLEVAYSATSGAVATQVIDVAQQSYVVLFAPVP